MDVEPPGGAGGPVLVPESRLRIGPHWRGVIRVKRAIITTTLAIAGLGTSYYFGGVLGNSSTRDHLGPRLIAAASALVFLVFALSAVRGATSDLLKLLPNRFGDSRATGLRLICLLVGYLLVILGALSLLHVPWSRLVLGGALTGVVLGVAAQPVLGNVFAGLVLLFTRPFAVGETVAIRAGALGGRVQGMVSDMTLIYVKLQTTDGVVLLPNSAVLAAAIGPPTNWDA